MADFSFDNIDFGSKELISEINESKLQILRLHDCWNHCNSKSKSGNLELWKWELDIVARELSPDMALKDEKIKNKDETYKERLEALNKGVGKAASRSELYEALSKKEIFLRITQDQVGKGSKRRSADEDGID